MLIVEDGRVISHTALNAAGETTGLQYVRLRFSQPVTADALAGLAPDIALEDSVTAVVTIAAGDEPRLQLLRGIVDRGLPIVGFTPEQKSLSRFYLDNVVADRKARQKGVAL